MIGNVNWDVNKLGIYWINKYIKRLGSNFVSVMDAYFKEFKDIMH